MSIYMQILCAKILTTVQLVQMALNVLVNLHAVNLMWIQGICA